MQSTTCNIQMRNAGSERGFTLVELTMVIVVTGILASSLVIPFISSIREATVPEVYATATYLAQEQIETARSTGYTATSTGTPNTIGGIGTAIPSPFITDEGAPNERTYTMQVVTGYVTHSSDNFSSPVSSPSSEFIKVKVTVSNTNMPTSIELWTILTKDFYDPLPN